MKRIKYDALEMEIINTYGELSPAAAEKAMVRNELNFNDIEDINEHYEEHRWGSSADRKYRKAAINKATMRVAKNPLKYGGY